MTDGAPHARGPVSLNRVYTAVMRSGVAALGVVVVGLLASAATGPGLQSSMSVVSSPARAGAHAVRLTVTLKYEMQCSYPGAGPVVVTFPAAVKLPKTFVAGSVLLAGKRTKATVSDNRVTVTVPPHAGLMCDVMGPGQLVLTFTPSAKLSNPVTAGSYRFTATHARHAFAAALTVGS